MDTITHEEVHEVLLPNMERAMTLEVMGMASDQHYGFVSSGMVHFKHLFAATDNPQNYQALIGATDDLIRRLATFRIMLERSKTSTFMTNTFTTLIRKNRKGSEPYGAVDFSRPENIPYFEFRAMPDLYPNDWTLEALEEMVRKSTRSPSVEKVLAQVREHCDWVPVTLNECLK